MKKLSLTDLAKIIDARIISMPSAKQTFSSVNTDSRTIKPGECFFAIAGENFDGHNFLADVFAKGASCAVVSQDIPADKFPDKVILKVSDTIKALGDLARWYRKECNFKVIAITGSVGKTTTRQIIYQVLSQRFKTFQSPKNFNNFIGLPLTLLAAEPDCQIVIAELGTNHPGEIEYLASIASPDVALVTSVAPAHLEGFGDLETLTKEKLSISEGLNPEGTLIINGDCPELVSLARSKRKNFFTFGTSQECDYRAENMSSDGLSSKFQIAGFDINVPLAGIGNAYNALAAFAVCDRFSVSLPDFADAIKTIGPISMRTELLNIGPLTVINDCYNANPASMKNALDILTTLAANQKRRAVFVCGDMAELGNEAEKLHVELGQLIGRSGIGLLITIGKLSAQAADAAKQARRDLQTRSFTDTAELCNNLHQLIKDSDIILVKGSRINKLETVVEKLKQSASAVNG